MSPVALLGAIGGIAFACCGVPVAWATLRAGKSVGTPVSIALFCILGSLATYAYLLLTYGFNPLLTANYSVEFATWAVVAWYHFFPRRGAS